MSICQFLTSSYKEGEIIWLTVALQPSSNRLSDMQRAATVLSIRHPKSVRIPTFPIMSLNLTVCDFFFFFFFFFLSHHQLRHYISTADRDRIYVASEKTVFAIHISSRKVETLADVPFEPKCLTAGHGWIGLGGADNGECAFIKLSAVVAADSPPRSHQPRHADVDNALPLDLEAARRPSHEATPPDSRAMLEIQLHKFGGAIVNSVTIHRFPNDPSGRGELVMVLSNNDRTVTIYSLTREKVLKVITHPNCMNYAVISPDSTILAAVGDENRAYFYEISRGFDVLALSGDGPKYSVWDCSPLHCIKMDTGADTEDRCCFTIAFSPSNHLCAIAAQSGTITVFDVDMIRDPSKEAQEVNAATSVFCSSQYGFGAGAVRCMAFSPEPWDLLVWVEDHGRAGIADLRQAFLRRQILDLDFDDPGLQKVTMESSEQDSSQNSEIRNFGEYDYDPLQQALLDAAESYSDDPSGDFDRSSIRDSLIYNLSGREAFAELLQTARWSTRTDAARRGAGPARWRMRDPPHTDSPESASSDVVLSFGETANNNNSNNNDPHANRASIRRLPEASSGRTRVDASNPSVSTLDSLTRQRSSARRSPELSDTSPESRYYDRHSELRANLAADRAAARRQRQLINEGQNRHNQWERRYRYPPVNLERARLRMNPISSLGVSLRNYDSRGTAGAGWGVDGRSL